MNNAQMNWLVALVFGVTLTAVAPQAQSQNQARVGDLVEYVSGLGPTLAEVVVGPDASGYVVLLLPTGKQVPVNTQKLRLVQSAGTPNAPIAVGEAVGWLDGGVAEKGNVMKVNGNWCQVKTATATTIGWIECKALRTTARAAAPAKPAPTTAAAGKSATMKLQGSWENADGAVKLDVQAGNKCFISFGPMTGPCAYKQSANGITVLFDGEELALVANEDGSLSSVGDPTAMTPIRLKRK
ncbi:MAG TPA: hypothetical protein VFA81_00365 [Burkholderiales bacterium]|nr:hypothetical protein [Burkholderiales bacterium]